MNSRGADWCVRGLHHERRTAIRVEPAQAVSRLARRSARRWRQRCLAWPTRKDLATLILSNHFLRYVLVPWSDALSDAGGEIAFARHCFAQVYGKEAAAVGTAPESRRRLACRSWPAPWTRRLLDAVRRCFQGAGVALKSVQPHLMAAYNGCRASSAAAQCLVCAA